MTTSTTTSTDSVRAQSWYLGKCAPMSIRLTAAGAVALVALQAHAGISERRESAAPHVIGTEIREPAAQPPIALVVGNSDYEHFVPDSAGTHDAEAVAQALAHLGFQVMEGVNLDQTDFVSQVVDFHRRSRGRSAALFYYSGHAMSGRSFAKGRVVDALLPVDTPDRGDSIGFGVVVADVLAGMDGDVNLMLLDADMTARTRVQRMNTLIAYAGELPRIVELEGGKSGGRFTTSLLAAMVPGIDVVDLLQQVIQTFPADAADFLPWMESSLRRPYRLPTHTQYVAQKLDARLVELIEMNSAEGLEAATAHGAANGVDVDEGRVEVRVLAKSEDHVDAVKRLIDAGGGSVRTTFENNVYASVPLIVLALLARRDAVYRIDLEEATVSPTGGQSVAAPEAPEVDE